MKSKITLLENRQSHFLNIVLDITLNTIQKFKCDFQIILYFNEEKGWEVDIYEITDCTRIEFNGVEIIEISKITDFMNYMKDLGFNYWDILTKEASAYIEKLSQQQIEKLNKIK